MQPNCPKVIWYASHFYCVLKAMFCVIGIALWLPVDSHLELSRSGYQGWIRQRATKAGNNKQQSGPFGPLNKERMNKSYDDYFDSINIVPEPVFEIGAW